MSYINLYWQQLIQVIQLAGLKEEYIFKVQIIWYIFSNRDVRYSLTSSLGTQIQIWYLFCKLKIILKTIKYWSVKYICFLFAVLSTCTARAAGSFSIKAIISLCSMYKGINPSIYVLFAIYRFLCNGPESALGAPMNGARIRKHYNTLPKSVTRFLAFLCPRKWLSKLT